MEFSREIQQIFDRIVTKLNGSCWCQDYLGTPNAFFLVGQKKFEVLKFFLQGFTNWYFSLQQVVKTVDLDNRFLKVLVSQVF